MKCSPLMQRVIAVYGLALAAAVAHACGHESIAADICPATACPRAGCAASAACKVADADADPASDTYPADCPLGTSCVEGLCEVVAFPRLDSASLITGFDVPEFELRAIGEGSVEFDWVNPQGARRVVCALFVSPPQFASDQAGGDQRLTRMSNTGRAITRERIFNTEGSGSEQRFTFRAGDLEPSQGDCSPPLSLEVGSLPADYPVVDLLRIGCWALDSARVIAATRLITIPPTALPDASSRIEDTCQGLPETTWCRMPGTPGTCQQGECVVLTVPRTLPAADSAADAGTPPGTGTPTLKSCKEAANDSPCVIRNPMVGQCLGDECVGQGSDSYRQPLVVSSCGDGSDGLNCYPSPVLGFGNCLEGACLPRCRRSEDCVNTYTRAGLERPDGPRRSCSRTTAYVGLCRDEAP